MDDGQLSIVLFVEIIDLKSLWTIVYSIIPNVTFKQTDNRPSTMDYRPWIMVYQLFNCFCFYSQFYYGKST